MHALSTFELTIFLLAIGLMLLFARILSKIGHQFSVPTLAIEVIAGIILGPTLLGAFFPEIHAFFFPETGSLILAYDTLFNLAIVMLLFVGGLELDFDFLKKKTKDIIVTSAFNFSVPFIGGCLFAWYFFDFLKGVEIPGAPFAFPLAFAFMMSISALPILTRILMGHGVLNTQIGIVVIGVALIDDLIGWFGYSSLLIYASTEKEKIHILYTFFYIIIFFLVMFFITSQKKLMAKIFTKSSASDLEPSYDLAMLFAICLLTAAFTNAIEIHSALGAFIAGIVCKRIIGNNHQQLLKQLDTFVLNFFAPIFFISIGLQLNFLSNFNLWMIFVVFLLATFTKLAGAYTGARLSGIAPRASWAIGFCLNARGAMEIIMGTLAYNIGLIGEELYVTIIIVALSTSFLAEFAVGRILKLKTA